VWLCNVTKVVFGGAHPRQIFVRWLIISITENRKNQRSILRKNAKNTSARG
jgi:hypothetical protein